MHFKHHSNLTGQHAFLSPSSYHWVNYTPDKLEYRFGTSQAAILGVEQHRYAAEQIARGIFEEDEDTTLGMFINDSIRFRMWPEVVLYYSDNCFGTADAIVFRYNKLRISDLKTGVSKASEKQLEVYAAIFCLEYDIDPYSIRSIELRIYQDNEVRLFDADPKYIWYIMDKIVEFDEQLNQLRMEESYGY